MNVTLPGSIANVKTLDDLKQFVADGFNSLNNGLNQANSAYSRTSTNQPYPSGTFLNNGDVLTDTTTNPATLYNWNGKQWVQLTTGANGKNGTNGTNGKNGTNGTNGTNGVGVPAGGTRGQTLVKNSNTDYDTKWATPAASSTSLAGSSNSNAAGYLIVGNGITNPPQLVWCQDGTDFIYAN